MDGKIIAGNNARECQRFLDDLERKDIELRTHDPDLVIGLIEKLIVHKQGEALDGTSLVNKPLKLQSWQKFIVYNLVGFYFTGTNERRYKEAFIFVPRKQGKTLFIAALAFALSIMERKSGSRIYITAASLKQAQQSFDDIVYSLKYKEIKEEFRIRDNNAEHSMSKTF